MKEWDSGWGNIAKTILSNDPDNYEKFIRNLKEWAGIAKKMLKKDKSWAVADSSNLDFSSYEVERTKSNCSYKQSPLMRVRSATTLLGQSETETAALPSRRLSGILDKEQTMGDPFEKEVEKRALRSKQRFSQLREQMHSLESSHGV